jgi:hypothetical protein
MRQQDGYGAPTSTLSTLFYNSSAFGMSYTSYAYCNDYAGGTHCIGCSGIVTDGLILKHCPNRRWFLTAVRAERVGWFSQG